MARVEFLGPIKHEPIEVEANSLKELKEYFKDDKELQPWLKICAVSVNDKLVCSSDIKLNKEDKVSLLPPVCGG